MSHEAESPGPAREKAVRTIWFETHATSLDNEAGLASGRFDVDLSSTGVEQAVALGRRHAAAAFERILTSDLRRAWRTAEIAFGGRAPIHRDPRLAECDYGRLTRARVRAVEEMRLAAVDRPFPDGESYHACTERVRRCLAEHIASTTGDLLVIGHRATHYALESLFNRISLSTIVAAPWCWQPGWQYPLTNAIAEILGVRQPD